jgi:peptide/nickel transport system substrate-binding protein
METSRQEDFAAAAPASLRADRLPSCGFALLLSLILILGAAAPAVSGERIFTQRITGQPPSLDPAKTSAIQADQVMWLLYDRLTQLSADAARMEPSLAERWEVSPDGLTYTFHLRPNVRFHDGSVLDAQAVKVSYERQYLAASPFYTAAPPNAYESVLAGWVKEVRVLDPLTVAITQQYPRPQQFALVNVVSPQALTRHGKVLTRTPVGTGPFRFERWEGDRIVLTAFVDSWRGRPWLNQVTYLIVPDTQAAMDGLEAGEFDLMPEVTTPLFERLASNPLIRLVKVGGLNVRFLGMQVEHPPLRDRRVREAIASAVDRERLAEYLGRGAMIPASGPLPPASLGYDPQIRQPAYDPQRARALLQEAALPTPPTLRLLYNTSLEMWAEVAQAVRSDLHKVGIEVELRGAASWPAYHEQRKKGDDDLYLYGWGVSTPDPERFLFPLFSSKSPSNFGGFSDAKVDDLLAQARQPMEEARRLRLYREVSRLVVGQVPAVFLFHQINFAAVNRRVSGLTLNIYGLPQDKLSSVEIH